MSGSDGRLMAAVGMFDGVHLGHRFLLGRLADAARERGCEPAAVTFADHPLRLISPDRAPQLLTLAPLKERLIAEAGVSRIITLDFNPRLRQLTAAGFMAMLAREHGVSAILMGYDHRFGSDRLTDPADYRRAGLAAGVEILTAPPLGSGPAQISSSAIRSMLGRGLVADAASALGRPYRLEGTVEGGRRIGRSLGFPTANMATHPRQCVPAQGVYAALASVPGADGPLPAMVNIGRRPTVESGEAPIKVEAHLISYEGNLYDRAMSLDFVGRIRREQAFPSLDALRHQLEADRTAATAMLAAQTVQ